MALLIEYTRRIIGNPKLVLFSFQSRLTIGQAVDLLAKPNLTAEEKKRLGLLLAGCASVIDLQTRVYSVKKMVDFLLELSPLVRYRVGDRDALAAIVGRLGNPNDVLNQANFQQDDAWDTRIQDMDPENMAEFFGRQSDAVRLSILPHLSIAQKAALIRPIP